ncbi:MAG: PIN domain protein [Planctomycetota bacterium]
MRIYLDNCCFNRPFDNQSQMRVRLESEAKLHIQEKVLSRDLELVWSYILDYENQMNPFGERKKAIGRWKYRAVLDIDETRAILGRANALHEQGMKNKDALHIACAFAGKCEYFVTTDDLVLKHARDVQGIKIVDPPTFVREAAI